MIFLFLHCEIIWGVLPLIVPWNSVEFSAKSPDSLFFSDLENNDYCFYFARCVCLSCLSDIILTLVTWPTERIIQLFRFSSMVQYKFLKYILKILWISFMSVPMSSFPFFSLLIWVFFLYFLTSVGKVCQSYCCFQINSWLPWFYVAFLSSSLWISVLSLFLVIYFFVCDFPLF